MPIILTDEIIINAIEAVLAERGPDFVYEGPEVGEAVDTDLSSSGCVYGYVDPSGELHASCLIGAAFHRIDPELLRHAHLLGDPVRDSYGQSYRYGGAAIVALLDNLTVRGIIMPDYSERIEHALRTAQNEQDAREPYAFVGQQFLKALQDER